MVKAQEGKRRHQRPLVHPVSHRHEPLGVGGRGRSPLIRAPATEPVSLPEAFGGNRRLSVVTEGYRRSPPPCRRLTPGSPPTDSVSTEAPNIRCILLAMFKSVVFFLRCFGPFGSKGFHLGDVTKPRFLRGFGLQEGARSGKIGILRSSQHRWPKHGPNIAPKMAQHGAT